MSHKPISILAALAMLTGLAACGSKLTVENYDKITVGMKYDEVITLIGKPEKCDDVMGLRSCNWVDGQKSVSVSFAGSQVMLFSSQNLE